MPLTVDLINKLIKPVPNGSNSGSNYQIDKPVANGSNSRSNYLVK